MGYYATGRLEDMVSPEATRLAGKKMADRAGTHMERAIQERTPINVAYRPPGPGQNPAQPDPAESLLPRRERPPGTLRESIHRGRVKMHRSERGTGWEVRVSTEDPVAKYVEWDTRPHEITPTEESEARARARGRPFAVLVFYHRGQIVYTRRVHHPGTRGKHMFARGAAWTESEFPTLVEPELREWEREVIHGERSPVDETAGRLEADMGEAIFSFLESHTIPIAGSGQRGVDDLLGHG